MSDRMVTPKFLTQELAKQAVEAVLTATMKRSSISKLLKRQACHIVILVPSTKKDHKSAYANWPNYQIAPQVLYEHSVGNKKDWTGGYDDIATCKALQLWHGHNDDRTNIIPHLLFPGDTPFWGGVYRDGIIVTCSGIQPWFDKMIAGMIADMLIGLAYNAWMTSEDRKNDVDWLT